MIALQRKIDVLWEARRSGLGWHEKQGMDVDCTLVGYLFGKAANQLCVKHSLDLSRIGKNRLNFSSLNNAIACHVLDVSKRVQAAASFFPSPRSRLF